MENTEINNNKIQAGVRLDPNLFDLLEQMRIEEDRPLSNMISVLLKSHPRIQERLESESTAVAA